MHLSIDMHLLGSRTARVAALAIAAAVLAVGPARAVAPATPAVVARIYLTPIRGGQFDHWMNVANLSRAKLGARPKLPAVGTKVWNTLRDQVMQFLISGLWIEGEARLHGITVRPAQVRRTFRRTRDKAFPSPAAFRRYLTQSGMTVADIVRRVRLDALSGKLRARIERGVHGAAARQRALDAFVVDFQRRWKAKTACAEPYATAGYCGTPLGAPSTAR